MFIETHFNFFSLLYNKNLKNFYYILFYFIFFMVKSNMRKSFSLTIFFFFFVLSELKENHFLIFGYMI